MLRRRAQLTLGRGIGRRYALSFLSVALGLAFAAGALNAISAYRQARDGADAVLTARAEMAAMAVETFFAQIEATLSWASQSSLLREPSAATERRAVFMRALQRHPAITEIYHLDDGGAETLRLSKRRLDGLRSNNPSPRVSVAGGGPTSYSGVYFQHGSEPYMLMRVRDAGNRDAAVFAEINLRAIWEAITRARIGETGYAYIINPRGELVSHFDPRLALTRLDFSQTSQFREASASASAGPKTARSFSGQPVAFGVAPIAGLGWTVIAELPTNEAYAPFYRSLRQSLAMLALALLAACGAALLLSRQMAGPIRSLQSGARRFAEGQFAHAIPVVGDEEVAALAVSLNKMAAQIETRERDLRDSRERYALSASGARDGLWDWDLRQGEIYFSSRWQLQVGRADEARTGRFRDWLAQIDRRDRRTVVNAVQAHLSGATPHMRCEYRVNTPSGPKWFLARGLAVRTASGRPVRMAGSQTNITVLRAALEQVAEHRDHLEQLVAARTAQALELKDQLANAIETASDGIVIFDGAGMTVQSNARFTQFYDITRTSVDTVMTLATVAAGLGAACRDKLKSLQNGGSGFVEEIGPIEGRWFEMRGQALGTAGFLLRMADITPYREAAAALRSALDKERTIARAHSNFVAMTSHQFRTPLAIIDAAAQRLARRRMQIGPVEIEERAIQIRGVVRRITELTERTLNLSMLDAGTLGFKPRPDNLRALIELAVAAQALVASEHRIEAELADHNGDCIYDPTLIEQVVSNLLANAVKFTPPGRPIRVRLADEGGGVRVSIIDRGIGIPDDELNSIFDRFFRARNAAGVAGSGLGLTLCSEIIRLHGGAMEATSREGEGSTFSFTLPRLPDQEASQ